MITPKVLTRLNVPHYIVVEPQEVDIYQSAIDKLDSLTTILTLDFTYKEKYELCDGMGLSKSPGAGPSRNFAWDHSIAGGFSWHWVMDDNIEVFYRVNRNLKVRVKTGAIFRAMEDFVLRYTNVSMAGPNYEMFFPRKEWRPPFVSNTRIYSCNLIRNDVPFRWRGRYNEDTILSLDMLKKRWCTIQFNAFLQDKMTTRQIKGGNTDELYGDGTLEKSQMQVRVHPDVSRLAYKFGRPHHHVNYSVFKKNKLRRKSGVTVSDGINNYGMELKIKPK